MIISEELNEKLYDCGVSLAIQWLELAEKNIQQDPKFKGLGQAEIASIMLGAGTRVMASVMATLTIDDKGLDAGLQLMCKEIKAKIKKFQSDQMQEAVH
jgi:hypothetical protein